MHLNSSQLLINFELQLEKNIKKPGLGQASSRIISHMNEELQFNCLFTHNRIKDINARMVELFVNGFNASSENKVYFLTFEKSCSSPEEYKHELIKHAKKYRDYEI